MITVSQIRGGQGYMSRHLSANDYYSENETVIGHWKGKVARILGLEGKEVTAQVFDSLATNRHHETGERFRPRDSKVSFHDFVVSAPKSVSVAALVGGDERLREAYERCVSKTFVRLESLASRRERKGEYHSTEQSVNTGNVIAAVFHHDTSRLLDPQLHSHLVIANLTLDEQQGAWYALQPKMMAEQGGDWIRQRFYRDLERECQRLGYRTQRDGEAFRLADVSRRVEVSLSQRTLQKESFITKYEGTFGHRPDKKRVEQFIKDRKGAAVGRFKDEFLARFGAAPSSRQVSEFVVDWRSDKMASSSKAQVAELQRSRLGNSQWEAIQTMVNQSRKTAQEIQPQKSQGMGDIEDKLSMSPPPAAKVEPSLPKQRKFRREQVHQDLRRTEVIRRMKRGLVIAKALQGHPAGFLAAQIRASAKKRNEAKRRV